MSKDLRESAVFLWPDKALFLGDRSETGLHSHNAIELCLALDELGICMATPGGPTLAGVPGAVVSSDVPHRLSIPGPKVAVLYVDPRAGMGPGLEDWLSARPIAALEASALEPHLVQLRGLFERDRGIADAEAVITRLVGQLARLDVDSPGLVVDSRVQRVLALLAERLESPPTQAEAAAHAGISSSRLAHLFKEQVGLPMRRYVLWLRLRRALTVALGGKSMTEAAHTAGFSDAAHFTRTCQRMFGLPPSAFAPVEEFFLAT